MDRIIELAEKYADEMIENRRKIHKNPELGGQETISICCEKSLYH